MTKSITGLLSWRHTEFKFEHIKGKSNVLVDTLSRLISIDTDVKLEPELEGHEFGQYYFEELPKASSYTVNEIITGTVIEAHDADITEPVTTYSIPLPSFKICELQESDEKLCLLHPRIEKGHLVDSGYFTDKEGNLLWQRILDNLQEFEPVVLPDSLISTALLLAHDHTGDNGFRRTYAALKWLYYWKGMKKDVCKAEGDDDKAEEVQIQEEEGIPALPDWVEMVQNLDVTLDAHQVDKILMLLQCHAEMLEHQAMVSKMLVELGKSVDLVTFRLILQTVIQPIHHINIPDLHMPAPEKTKKVKLMREVKMICCIAPNPDLMKDWVEDSVTLYLATTLYYWFEKIIMKSSNMKWVAGQFRV